MDNPTRFLTTFDFIKLLFTNMPKEFITHESGNSEAWICVCGNLPGDDGFYPCATNGDEVEPTAESGWVDLYVCARCGKIINQNTLEVVGRNPHPKMLD